MTRLIDRACDALALAIGALFLVGVAINFANVVGRYLFGWSLIGGDEAQIFIMVWMAFVGAVVVTWREQHLRMDVLLRMAPEWVRTLARVSELLLLAVLAGFVAVQAWRYVTQMLAIDRRSEALGLPMAVPHAALLAGFAAIALVAVWKLVALSRGERGASASAREGADA